MEGNFQNSVYFHSNSNLINLSNFPQSQHLTTEKLPQNSNNMTYTSTANTALPDCKNKQDPLLPPKLIKTGLFITSLNIPQQMKDNLIKKVLKSTDFKINLNDSNLYNSINLQSFINKSNKEKNANKNLVNKSQFPFCPKNSRVMFTKEEDERIKQLVKKFGTGHWDLIAHFMERRTAKQCRDRYSNYLIPGYFQGEWSKEEDELLIQLYKKNGPKWSVLQRYFPNRGANNIKNRWQYFLGKQNQNLTDTKIVTIGQITSEKEDIRSNEVISNFEENKIKIHTEINLASLNTYQNEINKEGSKEEAEEKGNFFEQEDEPKNHNLFEIDNEWMMFN